MSITYTVGLTHTVIQFYVITNCRCMSGSKWWWLAKSLKVPVITLMNQASGFEFRMDEWEFQTLPTTPEQATNEPSHKLGCLRHTGTH